MNKQMPKSKKLDDTGRNLIRSLKLPSDEIEKIVTRPNLFNYIEQRIEADRPRHTERIFFTGLYELLKQNIPLTGLAVLFILSALAGAAMFSRIRILENEFAKMSADAKNIERVNNSEQLKSDYTDLPNRIFKAKNTKSEAKNRQIEEIKQNKLSALKKYTTDSNSRIKNSLKRKSLQSKPQPTDDDNNFQPLIFAENLIVSEDSRQIVRVELTRDSLLSMGINLPIGDDESVKTDLLVGSDGTPQAIRFVKNF